MIVFRILCGEWIETMWDCCKIHGFKCVPFFICAKIIGGFVVTFTRRQLFDLLFNLIHSQGSEFIHFFTIECI